MQKICELGLHRPCTQNKHPLWKTLEYSNASVLGRSEDKETLDEILRSLEDSLTVNFAHHVDDPNVGLPLNTDYSQYKMYVGDTGLFESWNLKPETVVLPVSR